MDEIKTYCKSCERETNHSVKAAYKPKDTLYEYAVADCNEYYVVECLGCNHTGFLHIYWYSEDENNDSEELQKWEEHYPFDEDRFGTYRFLNEEDQDELPAMIFDMYSELKLALQHDMNVLAGVGLRMVVEAVCIKQEISGRALKDKILNLLNNGLISKNDHEVIDKLREIGNISTHQIKGPSATIMEAALEAVNHLLRVVYVIQKRTKKLRKKSSQMDKFQMDKLK